MPEINLQNTILALFLYFYFENSKVDIFNDFTLQKRGSFHVV